MTAGVIKSGTAMRVMVMAAGTGGHIFPGLAIAQCMRERGWEVSWLGTLRGMERDLVPRQGIPMESLDFSGMRGKGWRHSLTGAVRLVASFWQCRQILRRIRPDVIVGMGGYVTLPGGVMARLLGIPLVLVNADAALLLSTKLLMPCADRVLLGLPIADATTDHSATANAVSAKIQVTGNPIRTEICQLPEPASRFAGRTGPLRLLVVGGSLGAMVLNRTVPAALALIPEEQRPVVTHQSGKQHMAALSAAYDAAGVKAEIRDFIDDMPQRYAAADLVICRAGAITVSELTAAGVASVLVPFMASSTTHQSQNAQWMARQQAAVYMAQTELTAPELARLISELTREKCLKMAQAAYTLGQRQATTQIAEVLEQLVRK